MADNADTMVLRSFHLPQGTDDELRGLAFALHCAKADLLRFFIDKGMDTLVEDYGSPWRSWDAEALARVAKEVKNRGESALVKQGLTDDIARFDEASA
jgi:hypothetical protein